MSFHVCKNLQEMLDEATSLQENTQTLTLKLSALQLFNTQSLSVNIEGTVYYMREHALRQYLKRLKIPFSYFMACTPELREKEIREAFEDASDRATLHVKTKSYPDDPEKTPEIYGIVDSRYHSMSTLNFVNHLSQIPDTYHIISYAMELEQTMVTFIGGANNCTMRPPFEGCEVEDEFHTGFTLYFSEVAKTNIIIQPTAIRCTSEVGFALDQKKDPCQKVLMMRYDEQAFLGPITSPDTMVTGFLSPYLKFLDNLHDITFTSDPDPIDEQGNYAEEYEKALRLVGSPQYLKDLKPAIMNLFSEMPSHTLYDLLLASVEATKDLSILDEDIAEDRLGAFLSKAVMIKADMAEHNEPWEFTLPFILRACTKHSLRNQK